ncbi:hypothetical protein Aeqsu_2072 [Aequorivita sublithincola DSM 14238]|uniref:Uncharacterized protein n=1 Tax=Aequorivita sublithincola (strain DSM 14238 / LMG 21431 / ACAM 643 / 9-3) TaxID=746697 RepID=I3YX18_AEQSU|nr:hypothetical protein [Aequorivita sublithincola]AFL81536.1 hypothetical protein Aeqsu_2072 [Aequorivita sublithincola DSM 14238]
MKAIFIILSVFFLISCSKNDDSQEQFVIDLGASFSIQNAAGDDLLDPNNPNAFKQSDIKTYHLINGEVKLAGADDMLFLGNNGLYVFGTFVNYEGNDEFPITYIDWSETDRDTIKSEIYRTENQIRAIKVWYNDTLMWDVENGDAPYFTIVK